MYDPSTRDDKLPVPALGRAKAVLDHLAQSGEPVGISELSRQLKIAKSTLHGLCETLVRLGLLQTSNGGFEVGPHVLGWSAAYLGRNDMSRAFEHVVSRETQLLNYTLTLTILDGDNVVYIGCRNSARPLGFTFQIGMRLPAVFSATGKAIMASMPDAERLLHIPKSWPQPFTARGVARLEDFETQIAQWQDRGYAVDNGEIRDGMFCVGVPIRNRSHKVIAGLAISMTEAEANEMGVEYFAKEINSLADKLTYCLA